MRQAVRDFMGYDRATLSDRFLWHNSAPPREYYDLAQQWGLNYAEADFHLSDPVEGRLLP